MTRDKDTRKRRTTSVAEAWDSFPQEKKLVLEENVLYIIIWLVIGLAFGILGSLEALLPFFVLFVLHNYVVFPFCFKRRKKALYIICDIVLLGLLTTWVFTWGNFQRNQDPFDPGVSQVEMGPGERMFGDSPQMDGQGTFVPEDRADFSRRDPRRMTPRNDARRSRFSENIRHGGRRNGPDEPPHPLGPTLMRILMGILIILANVGAKAYFQYRKKELRMEMLQKENLDQQLQYLRYQINPHFFMNTLNNIHALVDIDPEQAKSSILELSRMMRYILYEGDKPTIPLSKETEFLKHYIYLMRIRYSDSVKIDVDLPEECGNVEVPPLIFVSFVENAFKHGISYETDSFIKVSMALESGKLIFKCINSRHGTNQDSHSGIGQSNVRKRLDLLYGQDYTLHIDSNPEIYDILLVIPVKSKAVTYEEGDAEGTEI